MDKLSSMLPLLFFFLTIFFNSSELNTTSSSAVFSLYYSPLAVFTSNILKVSFLCVPLSPNYTSISTAFPMPSSLHKKHSYLQLPNTHTQVHLSTCYSSLKISSKYYNLVYHPGPLCLNSKLLLTLSTPGITGCFRPLHLLYFTNFSELHIFLATYTVNTCKEGVISCIP